MNSILVRTRRPNVPMPFILGAIFSSSFSYERRERIREVRIYAALELVAPPDLIEIFLCRFDEKKYATGM